LRDNATRKAAGDLKDHSRTLCITPLVEIAARCGRSLRIVACGILGIRGETAAAAVRLSAIVGDDYNLSRSQP
jgi:hypothetical protein